jgi:predicted O-linked N-acetylglucosamine transferase (SPINDLY family)
MRIQTNRKRSAVFDGGRFAQGLEKAYMKMWQIYTSGAPPRAFKV